MKNLITIAALLICLTAHAQHAVKDAQGNYHAIYDQVTRHGRQ